MTLAGNRGLFYSSLPAMARSALSSPAVCMVIASVLAVGCYWNGLNGDLVHDDIFAIRDNADVRPSTAIANIFRNDFWGKPMSSATSHKSYRPLTVLTFRLNFALHGLHPWGYHVVNLALHVLTTVLFGCFCRSCVFDCSDLAFMSMCLFAAHPVHTEAVTGVVGRADVVACLLFLLALMAYIGSTTPGQGKWVGLAKLVFSLFCGAAAMLFKEHGATVFGVCLAYDVLVISRKAILKLIRHRQLHLASLRPLLLRGTLITAIVFVLLAFRIWTLHGHLPHFSAQDNPASFAELFQTRILTYSYLFFFNVRLLLHPATLCYDWQMGSIPLVEGMGDWRNVGTLLFFVYLVALTLSSLFGNSPQRYKTITILGLLLLVIPFLPASNLLLRVGFVVAERILYIPSMGYCILFVHGVSVLSRRISRWQGSIPPSCGSPPPSPVPFYLTLVIVGFFAARTVARNPAWLTRESLFKSGLETVPHNAKIHFNYGNFLRDTGRTSEAIQHYRNAISLAPDHAVSHNNLGTLLGLEEGEHHFREAVKHNPQHYRAFFNLGANLKDQERLEEAEATLRASLDINPDYHDALMSLATLLADQGRLEEGWHYMQRAAAVATDNADVHNNLAAYLLRMDKQQDAIKAYEKTLQINPAHTTAMTSLARVYRAIGLNDKAEQMFKRSFSIKADASTLHYLGALYFNTARPEEARVVFQQALELDPERVETVCSYGQTLVQLGREEEAIRTLLETTGTHPNSGCLHLALANSFAQQKVLEKLFLIPNLIPRPSTPPVLHTAVRHSAKAVQFSDPSSRAEAYHTHGTILKDIGRLSEAEKSYRKAVALSPQMVSAQLNLGAVLHMQKSYSGARQQYETVLRLDPGNKIGQENLKKLERLEQSRRN